MTGFLLTLGIALILGAILWWLSYRIEKRFKEIGSLQRGIARNPHPDDWPPRPDPVGRTIYKRLMGRD